MNHQDAIQDFSVERYILGELSGAPREQFEEHLFECQECAGDLKAAVSFLEASRDELPALSRARNEKLANQKPKWYAWLLSPALLAPALAASLLVVGFETAVVLPAARVQTAQATTPEIVSTVSLAAGTSRGEDIRQVHAAPGSSFLVSFDIPPQNISPAYRCSLYAPSGALVWRGDVTAEQAKDTVTVRIPVASTQPGINRLAVEGISPAGTSGTAPLSTYQFLLALDK